MFATLVLSNGRIHTQDPRQPQVSALAVRGNSILAIGDDDSMRSLLDSTGEWIDLEGRSVTPGLVDAHIHFRWYSLGLKLVDLSAATSSQEALARVEQRVLATKGGEWITGWGWNQSEWVDQRFPTATDLDRVAPNQPVLLRHKSGHAAWVNSQALSIAGIGPGTPEPPGGQIERDSQGRPTGVLLEDAADLVSNLVPKPTEEQIVEAMLAGQELCLQAGLTGAHDFDGPDCFRALQSLRSSGRLQMRMVKNIPVARLENAVALGLRTGFGDDWLRIGGIKIFADGALGPRTAAMIAPYEGDPDNRGIVVTDKEEMMAYASKASANGLSVTVHAIGDKANHDVLDVYEAVRAEEGTRSASEGSDSPGPTGRESPKRLRHRIEHVQILHPDDLQRLSELGVIASMQPIHATSDMEMAEIHWGSRAVNSYAWRTLLESGATLAFGSDAPVESIEPLTGIYAAVTRRRPDGTPGADGWYPEQRLSLAETIRAYTMGPAFTSGREQYMGRISPGSLADLTIYDRDIFAIPPDELKEVEIAGTIVDGQFRYRSFQ